ncbi:MAG TPA: class I SAM-dependent methyltransferase [Dongiaceae bacterium]|jgi:SAM-dependent methyltransferase|nr:class I SAM-dependent methyltransferase [Dongiaceae bacterium]
MEPFKDHFSSVASAYARHRPDYPPELAAYFAEIAPRRGLAWDCGCGSGQFSRLLADHFAHVIATDPSAEQLSAAPRHPRIDYRQEKAERTSLPDHAVDIITVAQAAHWFALEDFYAEVRRVAAPGAILALITYASLETGDSELDRIINDFYDGVLGTTFWPPERRHIEAGYRTLAFPFAEIAAPPFSIVHEWSVADVLGYIETWSAVSNLKKAGRGKDFEDFSIRLAAHWAKGAARRRVRWPLAMRVGRVSAL